MIIRIGNKLKYTKYNYYNKIDCKNKIHFFIWKKIAVEINTQLNNYSKNNSLRLYFYIFVFSKHWINKSTEIITC